MGHNRRPVLFHLGEAARDTPECLNLFVECQFDSEDQRHPSGCARSGTTMETQGIVDYGRLSGVGHAPDERGNIPRQVQQQNVGCVTGLDDDGFVALPGDGDVPGDSAAKTSANETRMTRSEAPGRVSGKGAAVSGESAEWKSGTGGQSADRRHTAIDHEAAPSIPAARGSF